MAKKNFHLKTCHSCSLKVLDTEGLKIKYQDIVWVWFCNEVCRQRGISEKYLSSVLGTINKRNRRRKKREKKKERNSKILEYRKKSDAFLKSREWRELRYKVLRHYGALCLICRRGSEDKVKIHVDHIKPRYFYPELALEFNNLQVLCEDCNIGKGARFNDDWREKINKDYKDNILDYIQ